MKYITVTPSKLQSWEEYFVWANEDYVNYIFLAYHKCVFGTALWMAWQSIEKYYKAFLLKHGDSAPQIHDIGKLAAKAKKLKEYASLDLDAGENEWLSDIFSPVDDPQDAANNILIRYGSGVTIEALFTRRFISVGKKLRKLILGEQEYRTREVGGAWFNDSGGFTGRNEPSNYFRKVIFPLLLTA